MQALPNIPNSSIENTLKGHGLRSDWARCSSRGDAVNAVDRQEKSDANHPEKCYHLQECQSTVDPGVWTEFHGLVNAISGQLRQKKTIKKLPDPGSRNLAKDIQRMWAVRLREIL